MLIFAVLVEGDGAGEVLEAIAVEGLMQKLPTALSIVLINPFNRGIAHRRRVLKDLDLAFFYRVSQFLSTLLPYLRRNVKKQ